MYATPRTHQVTTLQLISPQNRIGFTSASHFSGKVCDKNLYARVHVKHKGKFISKTDTAI